MKLVLTLYKDCVLNKSYKNVFSHAKYGGSGNVSILDTYLNGLEHYEIEMPDVYYENTGTLVFDYLGYKFGPPNVRFYNIYAFNYCKIEQYDDDNIVRIKRYCFVDKIEIKNEVVYLTYSEDIWSSYGDKIVGTTKAYLERSRFHDYDDLNIPLKSLPIEYESNDMLSLQLYENKVEKVFLVVQLQLYKLVTGSETNPKNFERKNIYVCITPNPTYSSDEDLKLYLTTVSQNNLTNILRKLFSLMPVAHYDKRIDIVSADEKMYSFEIGNVYVFPDYFNFEFAHPQSYEDCDYIYLGTPSHTSPTAELYAFRISEFYNNTLYDNADLVFKTLYQKSLPNDYRNLSIGTFNTRIKLFNNGTTIDIKIQANLQPTQISIFLNANNEMLDITEDFNLKYPVESITSVEYMQRKISLAMENRNIEYQKQQNGLNMFNNYIDKTYGGMSALIGNAPTFNQKSGIRSSKNNTFKLTEMGIGLAESFYGIIGDIIDTAQKGSYLGDKEVYINTPQFTSSRENFTVENNFINCITGLVLFRCIPENEYFVENAIKDEGYVVYNYLEDWGVLNLNDENISGNNKTSTMYVGDNGCYFNSLRFASIDLYGSFTNEIARTLNEIFKSGVKIWFIDEIDENDSYDI